MKQGSPESNRVVDLLQYRDERHQRRLDFEAEPDRRPSLVPVTPFRPLSAQDVDHRHRMLRHLTLQRREQGTTS
jgi:hypothetical protein